jgi:hypothetical protein
LCVFALGCAVNDASRLTAIPAQSAANAITAGKSTKAEVAAALGKTTEIRFDSGFEVWAYQYQGETAGRSEFVVLFAPTGVVAKTRSRPVPSGAGKAP